MDHFVEYPSSDESNGYDFSNTSEKEAALYSLVHHSYDTYESNDSTLLNSGCYQENQRSKVLRWKSIQPTHSVSSDNFGQLTSFASHQEQDFMPLEDRNNVNTTGFDKMQNKLFDASGRWNNGKRKMHWNDRTENYIRNLVSVNLDSREDSLKKNSHMQRNLNGVTATTNSSPRNKSNPRFSVNDFAQKNVKGDSQPSGIKSGCEEVSMSGKDSNINDTTVCSSIESIDEMKTKETSQSNIPYGRGHFSKNKKRRQLEPLITQVDRNTRNNSVCIKIVDNVSDSNAKTSSPQKSQEIFIISDSEDEDSIVEVSFPPKSKLPVIALDSSDEAESATVIPAKLLLNVLPLSEQKVKCQIPISSNVKFPQLSAPQGHDNNSFNNSVTSVNSNSKQIKKKKKKKISIKSMVEFYNQSWGGETFDHIKIQKNMSNNPQLWKILDVDKCGPRRDPRPRVRCANCNQIGHIAKDCRDPKKIISCFMCGQQGHIVLRCPFKICLKCGRPASVFNSGCPSCLRKDHPANCTTCGDREHFSWLCPSEWRKLHAVTSSQELTAVNLQVPLLKPSRELSCCSCAGHGHTASQCPFLSTYGQNRSNNFVAPYPKSPRGMKRKRNRNSSFEWKNRHEFDRKRRKTN